MWGTLNVCSSHNNWSTVFRIGIFIYLNIHHSWKMLLLKTAESLHIIGDHMWCNILSFLIFFCLGNFKFLNRSTVGLMLHSLNRNCCLLALQIFLSMLLLYLNRNNYRGGGNYKQYATSFSAISTFSILYWYNSCLVHVDMHLVYTYNLHVKLIFS